jgi:choice-of-anchor B domain-containing protein
MKKNLVLFSLFLSFCLNAQLFSKYNINLLSITDPDTSIIPSPVGNRYSGCWGWYQSSKNKEYAISGSKSGTYFIDVSNPNTPTVSAFVPGKKGATWREMKTYQNYCYIISSDSKPNRFQIVDMQYLPDSVKIIHDSNIYFEVGHTIWIDKDKMYIGLTTFQNGYSPMTIWSLATPTAPVLLQRVETQIPDNIIHDAHDMYARNDTIYVSAGWQGLVVLKHDVANDTLIQIGSYTGYPFAGYNHSSMITQNGKYLMFCDEVPASLPIHMVDIQNLGNIQPIVRFQPAPLTTPHNPYIKGNNFAIVTCYQDGLYIYDISQPNNISIAGFFDTYPQGGLNNNNYGAGAYSGTWGSYPYLPSGLIIANDMQNGMFVLNANSAFTTTVKTPINPVGINAIAVQENKIRVYPMPAKDHLMFTCPQLKSYQNLKFECYDINEKLLISAENLENNNSENLIHQLNISELTNGIYFLKIISNNQVIAITKFSVLK